MAVACLGPATGDAVSYYLSPDGNDSATGDSGRRPWRTLARASRADFRPGDHLLLKGGEVFPGTLTLDARDAGTARKPVVVGSFGKGKAVIEAGDGDGVMARDAGGIRIERLVITGSGRAKNSGSGIRLVNTLPGSVRIGPVSVDDVEVRGFGREGLVVRGDAADGSRSGFRDVKITRVSAHDNAYYGILVNGNWSETSTAYAHSGVVVRDCTMFDNPGDPDFMDNHSGSGILLEDTDGGEIDRCRAWNNGWLCRSPAGGPCGIWAAAARRITIRRCEAFDNRTAADSDGGGFDFDGGVSESLMEDNYSHGNDGAGYLVYAYAGSPFVFRNNIVRNCVSDNDGRKNHYGGILVASDGQPVRDILIERNTVRLPPAPGATPFAVLARNVTNVMFRGNRFETSGGVPLVDGAVPLDSVRFEGNSYRVKGNGTFVINWEGRTFGNVREWAVATGQETRGGKLLSPLPRAGARRR